MEARGRSAEDLHLSPAAHATRPWYSEKHEGVARANSPAPGTV
jgi:hypothetical protein